MPDQNLTPFFSIVIPSLNEEKYLPKLLIDLSKQTFPLSEFEVIHVDADSEDKTVELANKSAGKLNFATYTVNKRNVAHQRNFGAKKAKGKWIIFMDADNRLPKYFLDGIKYQLAKNKECDVFGTMIAVTSTSKAHKAIENIINLFLILMNQSNLKGSMGSMIGAKKSVCNKIKFDEKQLVYEDSFFFQAAADANYQTQLFHEPKYFFSLRRYDKEGLLKMTKTVFDLNVRYITGKKDFSDKNFGYVMLGGSYYQVKSKEGFIKQIREIFRSPVHKQLPKIKQALRSHLN